MVQDDGPGLADESDFLGAIVAAERIAQWMEILSNDGMALSRRAGFQCRHVRRS